MKRREAIQILYITLGTCKHKYQASADNNIEKEKANRGTTEWIWQIFIYFPSSVNEIPSRNNGYFI